MNLNYITLQIGYSSLRILAAISGDWATGRRVSQICFYVSKFKKNGRSCSKLFYFVKCYIRRRGVVGRVPAFQPGGPGSIPGGVRNFNFCTWIGCVSFVCVLPRAVSCEGPDIVLATHSGRPALVYLSSVLVKRLLLPLQASDPRGFGL